jgi:ketosteroid isomerase-like protein
MLIGAIAAMVAIPGRAGAEDVRGAIESANKAFSAAFAKGDAAALADMYSDTAEVLPPGRDMVSGRAEIQKAWQEAIDAGLKGLELTLREVESHGDSAHEVGTWTLRNASGEVDHGKYMVVWKKQRGAWKLHRDMWNSSVAPR